MKSPQLQPWRIAPDGQNSHGWHFADCDFDPTTPQPRKIVPLQQNSGSCLPSMADLMVQDLSARFRERNSSQMFQTASGKPTALKESSIRRALSVLGEDEEEAKAQMPIFASSTYLLCKSDSAGMFQTGLGKPVAVKESSIKRALSVLGEEEVMEIGPTHKHASDTKSCFSNSLFQTGSGKNVNISSTGLIKARTLLGLEENHSPMTSRGFQHTMKSSGHVEKRPALQSQNRAFPSHQRFEVIKTAYKEPSIKFQTAGGRSISVSSDALERAMSLLGESEFGVSSSKVNADSQLFPFAREEKGCHEDVDKEDISHASLHQNVAVTNDLVSETQPPMEMFSNLKQVAYPLNAIGSGDDMPKQVVADAAVSNGSLRSKNAISCFGEKSSGNGHCSTLAVDENLPAKDFTSRSSHRRLSSGVLVEISNIHSEYIDQPPAFEPTHTNQKPVISDKRRFGGRSSVSPFKRPRRSRFFAPLNNSVYCPATDSSTLENFSFKTRMSTRYPFQHKRKSLKEFFGGPPYQNLSGKLSEKVKCMSPDGAKNYIFCVPSDSDGIGADTFQNMLVQSGASTLYASKELLTVGSISRGLQEDRVADRSRSFWRVVGGDKKSDVNLARGLSFGHFFWEEKAAIGGLPELTEKHMLQRIWQFGWVINHYKWIVWKLACLERSYPSLAGSKYLTVPNVLEELKYRYEREVNHGHRSALKKILEGDASSATMMVLCVSGVHCYPADELKNEESPKKISGLNGAVNDHFAKIELSDGWYSLDAILDLSLSKLLVARKLFVGQKIRIWGAGLSGWVGPVSPLEASETVKLVLHINGTYRAHWADRLGFCKGLGAPLAFRCIKSGGGLVPRTLVGVTRIYPVLYKERFTNGGSVVRSERMEAKILQDYNQRRSIIAEGIFLESRENFSTYNKNDNDSEEGAKLYKILEMAAEPEVLMATMSSEQLVAFKMYQTRQETIRQSDLQKAVEKALEEADLSSRQVTPFMRVRVVGLSCKKFKRSAQPTEGLVTIWQPTEKQQQVDLVEGCMYSVAGLIPLNSDSDLLHLQARGSLTQWKPLPPSAIENFEPFFTPRKSVLLSNLGEVPLASEFDIAGIIVYVGEVYVSGHQKKQWVFVTDGSDSGLESSGSSDCLLAVNFCSPIMAGESFAPVNYTLAGSTVGFFNLVKRARDQINHLWVADATENSTYSFCYNLPGRSHLKEAAHSVRKWAKNSLTIDKFRERVLHIIGVHGS